MKKKSKHIRFHSDFMFIWPGFGARDGGGGSHGDEEGKGH